VAVNSGLQQIGGVEASGMIVGAALGSAIVQGSLVLGIAGLTSYLPAGPRMVRRYGTTLLACVALCAVLMWDGVVSRIEGLVLVLVYVAFFTVLVRVERSEEDVGELPVPSRLTATQATVAGLAVVTVSAHMVVAGGVALAEALGMSQTLLAVVFVGAGTSLPELALSVRAAAEKHGSLSVGNVIGSNIFDLLVPVGVGATLSPVAVTRGALVVDLPAVTVVTVALMIFLSRRRGLQRPEAAMLLGLYVTYLIVRVGMGG
jgi:cation:H+ antiporter